MKEDVGVEVLGVDVGGSHIAAGTVWMGDGPVRWSTSKRKSVDSQASADEIINSWGSFLLEFFEKENRDDIRLGIAMPGPFDYASGVSYIKGLKKYDSLYGTNVKEALANYLGINPSHILFRNDAEAFLHGEVMHRKGLSGVKVVGITLGTGLGSAISENGKTKDVFRAVKPMHQGIAEDYISSRWFARRYKELSGEKLQSVEALVNGNSPYKEILFEEFAVNLAGFLDEFVREERASAVIIGGNIARCLHLFEPVLRRKMSIADVSVFQSLLWEDAALLGAAYLWDDTARFLNG